jgi:hypothetical protein
MDSTVKSKCFALVCFQWASLWACYFFFPLNTTSGPGSGWTKAKKTMFLMIQKNLCKYFKKSFNSVPKYPPSKIIWKNALERRKISIIPWCMELYALKLLGAAKQKSSPISVTNMICWLA